MGLYVNPNGMSKEDWLESHGTEVSRDEAVISDDSLPVVLVDNGPFTAAGIGHSERELSAFLDSPMDQRPKRIFLCARSDLEAVQPELKEMRR